MFRWITKKKQKTQKEISLLEINGRLKMFRAMQEKQYSAVTSNAKVLMKLICLDTKIKS